MAYIYRIEDEHGVGCYQKLDSDSIRKNLFRTHVDKGGHPLPYWDARKEEIFGFKNLRQLMRWFTYREIRILSRLGYEIVRTKIEVLHSDCAQLSGTRI